MTAEKGKTLIVMLLATLAVSFGEAMLAKGMKQSGETPAGIWNQLRGVATNGNIVFGTLLMMTYFGLYMLALRWADFSFVLPLTAVSYLIGAILAKYYLGETVTPTRWLGAIIITLGVVVVGLGSGSGEPPKP